MKRCIQSILLQNRSDYHVLFIDDASDYTPQQKNYIRKKLVGHTLVFNKRQQFSLKNAYDAIHTYVKNDDAIIINLDGDDWLIRKDVIDIIETTYKETGCKMTYGNCKYYNPGSPEHLRKAQEVVEGINQRYPKYIEKSKAFRRYYFLPLHLRTWKAGVFKEIPKKEFLRPDGSWIQFCEDQAIFLPMLEMSANNYSVIDLPLSIYNTYNPNSDLKKNQKARLFDEIIILKKPKLCKE